jgi:hypothetical protein
VNGDSGEIVGPAPGPVIVRVQGIGGDVVIVDGSRNATIEAGENIISVPLEAVRTRLELTWSFATVVVDNVATATPPRTEITSRCAEADVDTINVRVLQGTQLLQSVSVACSEGRVEIPAIPIRDADGDLLNLKLELEGTREQEGDSIFFGRDEDDADDVPDVNADNVDLRPTGVVSRSDIVLSPSIAFARIIWTEDCGVTQSANVDIQIASDGVSEGINVPCAEGNTLVALPPGTERVRVTLRGVNVQGDQFTAPDVIDNILVIPGLNTFRITGPG